MLENNKVFIGIKDFEKWVSAGLYLTAEHKMQVEYCAADKEFIFVEGFYPVPMDKCVAFGIKREIEGLEPEHILIFSDKVDFDIKVKNSTVTVARTDAPHKSELINAADVIITTPGTQKINCYPLGGKTIFDMGNCCINTDNRHVYNDAGLFAGLGVIEFCKKYLTNVVAKR